jgi:hypothetical protein
MARWTGGVGRYAQAKVVRQIRGAVLNLACSEPVKVKPVKAEQISGSSLVLQ